MTTSASHSGVSTRLVPLPDLKRWELSGQLSGGPRGSMFAQGTSLFSPSVFYIVIFSWPLSPTRPAPRLWNIRPPSRRCWPSPTIKPLILSLTHTHAVLRVVALGDQEPRWCNCYSWRDHLATPVRFRSRRRRDRCLPRYPPSLSRHNHEDQHYLVILIIKSN